LEKDHDIPGKVAPKFRPRSFYQQAPPLLKKPHESIPQPEKVWNFSGKFQKIIKIFYIENKYL
jgi:hypothetical protein